MRRLYAVLLVVVCLLAAVALTWAEEPQKKGKWYDIFRGKPTLASQEMQLRREQFELRKKLLSGEIDPDFRQQVSVDLQVLSEHLDKHQKAIRFLLENVRDIHQKELDGDKEGSDILSYLYERLTNLESHANKCGVHSQHCPYASQD